MSKTNHRKKLFLEMAIILLIAASIGLAVNHRMLLDMINGGKSAPISSPADSSADKPQIAPAGLLQVRELFEKKQAVFIDARETSAYAASHISKAVSLPLAEFERELPEFSKKFNSSALLVVYCSGYGCHDSRLLAERLLGKGYENVLVYEGGLPEWKDAGLPVEGTSK